MAVVSRVSIDLDASPALKGLNAISLAAKRTELAGTTAANKINGRFKALGTKLGTLRSSFSSLGAAVASVGLSAFFTEVSKTGIEAERTANRIKVLTGSAQETANVQKIAANAAKQFGLGQLSASQGVADLYARLAPMGIATQEIETVFIGANKAALNMGLTAGQTSNVMLQLSQALGSGVLQGDEFRSIAEGMPPILDAVATVMGKNRSELKGLASDGEITTEILIKAMGELENMNTVEPDSVRKFSAAMENLKVTIGTKLLPALTPLINGITGVANAFNQLPEPVQTLIIGFGAVVSAIAILGPPIAGLVGLIGSIGPAIASVVGAIGGIITAIVGGGGLVKAVGAIIAIFSGPVGWIAALVAVGVAAYAFRDKIGDVFNDVLDFLRYVGEGLYDTFVKPAIHAFNVLNGAASNLGQAIVSALTGIWPGIIRAVQNALNGLVRLVESAINSLIGKVNSLLKAINSRLRAAKLPTIPLIGEADFGTPFGGGGEDSKKFYAGGYVSSPTRALIGEGGSEYVIPASKMSAAMERYAAGKRGNEVVPNGNDTQVNVSTGPVMQMNGQNYVTQSDFEKGLRSTVNQVMTTLRRSPNTRAAVGI
jgi:tape measure domain-containing protein